LGVPYIIKDNNISGPPARSNWELEQGARAALRAVDQKRNCWFDHRSYYTISKILILAISRILFIFDRFFPHFPQYTPGLRQKRQILCGFPGCRAGGIRGILIYYLAIL